MPVIIPYLNVAGVKEVIRYPERIPSLDSQIIIYDLNTGKPQAIMDGNWITAHSPNDEDCDTNHCNGKNFCMSKPTMNWWSALVWCNWIGRELADVETACPHSLSARRSCINLNGRMNVSGNNFSWLSTQVSNSGGYYLNANGDIDTYHANKTNSGWHHALCK